MTEYPQTFSAESAPPELVALVERLMPLLLAGEHPTVQTLHAQFRQSRIASVTLTGSGFYASFSVPPEAPRVSPPSFAGGHVAIDLEGVEMGAGCVLFVHDGWLADLEGYTYGTESWPEQLVVRALGAAEPIRPPEPIA